MPISLLSAVRPRTVEPIEGVMRGALSARRRQGKSRPTRVAMIARISVLMIWLAALLVPINLRAAESRPRSILVLDQSELRGPFYHEIFTALRAEVSANPRSHISLYTESLDLSRFEGAVYEAGVRQLLKAKYRADAIGVIVVVGAAALERVLNWRSELWPSVPIVFTLVAQKDFERLKPPADVTGSIVQSNLADAVTAARAVVPGLESIALVGGAWDRQVVFGNWKDEIETATAGLSVTDLVGVTMSETRERVATLPERSAIIYSATYMDRADNFYPPATALSLIIEKANRPIVVAAETFLAPGGIGGYVLRPGVIGADAARLALRILDGESPPAIPAKLAAAVTPIFNWKQMVRWDVGESDLPPGSEIWFRDPTFWQAYRWQSLTIAAIILMQTGLISVLLHERKKRSDAEAEVRVRLTELAHVGRRATAGELSSSIAHELNQPLGAILTNAETAELILDSPSPDLIELKEILADIRRDDQRASQVIHRMRSFLKRTPFELKDIDLNDIMREAFEFLAAQAFDRNVALYLRPSPDALRIKGDSVQLQQVILNLIVNSMEAMSSMPYGRAVIGRTELNGGSWAIISISDTGPGIPSEKLDKVFDPFFSTKQQGMGIGLSIARTIVQAHKGQIWAENQPDGGAVFRLSMPLPLQ
jgi:signal transduction histidine kinase